MGNRIPNVCTDRAGSSSRAPSIPSRPSNPFRRAARRSATSKEASTSPSRSSHPIEGKARAARGRWGVGARKAPTRAPEGGSAARRRTTARAEGEHQALPRRRSSASASKHLDVEPDLHDVAVLDDVVLALDAELPDLLGLVPRAELEELVPVDDLGPDEAALEVAVDDARALGCLVARAEGPRRSEEHTSELQSLMRISYAVLCLKKKKDVKIENN